MKQTIAISAFASKLAQQSGYTQEFCERFLIEMFNTVADGLKNSKEVAIKGFGKFSVETDGYVGFAPDAAFADDVNAPFACFEPEILDDTVTDDILDEDILQPEPVEASADTESDAKAAPADAIEEDTVDAVTEQADDSQSNGDIRQDEISEESFAGNETADISATATEQHDNDAVEADDAVRAESHEIRETESREEYDSEVSACDEYSVSNDAEDTAKHRHRNHKRRSVWAFVSGVAVGALLGGGATYFYLNPPVPDAMYDDKIENQEQQVAQTLGMPNTEEAVNSITKNETDSIAGRRVEIPAVNEPIVYDTIKTTLAQLSRKHYGRYEFWVYIYEENKDVIPDPDLVEPNTRVVIPSSEKYGINAGSKESVNTAKAKATEIYTARNRKSK